MPVFVTSTQAVSRHGVFAVERTPPAAITPTGTGVACLVEQTPWGPPNIVYTPTGIKDLYNNFAPPGFDRTQEGYLAMIRKAWPNNQLKTVRVLGSTAVAATALIQTSGAVTVYTVTAKFAGANGNTLTATSSASSDGIAGHIKITVTVTGPSGTTSDVVDNLPTAAAPSPAPDLSKALLIGAITFGTAGTVSLGTVSFTTGSDGTINALAYTGTQGNNDQGLAKCESDTSIRFVFCGDPGGALRPAMNAALLAHAQFMTDRVAIINGVSGQTATQAQTDAANYVSTRVLYCDPWVYILDDITATKRLVPGAPFAGSVAAQLSPSTPVAWKNAEVIAMFSGINDLETDRGAAAGNNSSAGVATFIREINGGVTLESQNLTITPTDATRKNLSRTRMGDFIAISFVTSVRGFVDAPNVPYNQQVIVQALDAFMGSLKRAQNVDPNHRPHVIDYQIGNLNSANAQVDLAAGNFTVPLDVQTSAGMEKIFLSIRYGETVQVIHQS
jgi:phage tail sheath protein FI